MHALFMIEAAILALPAVAFLGLTLREVLWATSTLLALRTSHPDIGWVQAFSAIALWFAGFFAVGVLVALAVFTARRHVFRFGAIFWLGVLSALLCATLMYSPFGATATLAVVAPATVLALHSAYAQYKLRSVA